MIDEKNIELIPYADFNRWKELMEIVAEWGWFYAEEDYHRYKDGFGEENFNTLVAIDKTTNKMLAAVAVGFHHSIEGSPAIIGLGLYITLPALRGNGLGTKLFTQILDDPRFKDVNLGLFGADYMSRKYATKFGYDKFPNWHIYKNKINIEDVDPSQLVAAEGIKVVAWNEVDYDALVQYDTKIQGGIRRDNFLKAFLGHPTSHCKVALNSQGEIIGYGNTRPGVNKQLGLGPLYADDKVVAETLLKAVLETNKNLKNYETFRVFYPNTHKDAEELFNKLGNGKVHFGGESFPQFTKEVIEADLSRIYTITEYGLNLA